MVKRIIFGVCITAWVVMGTGCATGPKKTFSDRLAEARQSLAMIKVEPGIQSKTTQQVYSLASTDEEKKAAIEKEQELNDAFNKMLTACQGTLAGFESQGRGWGVTKVVIATVGTISGAIVVPALTAAAASANAVWISAFGGLSGASNAA
jgi:hypothetical protein